VVCFKDWVFLMEKMFQTLWLFYCQENTKVGYISNELIKAQYDAAMVAIQDKGLLSRLNRDFFF